VSPTTAFVILRASIITLFLIISIVFVILLLMMNYRLWR
jgi:hypothetical protein